MFLISERIVMRTRIDIELIDAVQAFRRYIHKLALSEIDFYENGEKLDIPEELVDEFELTGLNNIDFITTGYYKKDEATTPLFK